MGMDNIGRYIYMAYKNMLYFHWRRGRVYQAMHMAGAVNIYISRDQMIKNVTGMSVPVVLFVPITA